jgi:hypothetical protein
MFSNSKLTKLQKAARKEMMAELVEAKGAIVTSSDGTVTVASIPEFEGSRMLSVGVSVASPQELNIRRKVGEYHALDNLMFGVSIIKVPDGTDMDTLAEVIAGFPSWPMWNPL